jgi:hypothetical protein
LIPAILERLSRSGIASVRPSSQYLFCQPAPDTLALPKTACRPAAYCSAGAIASGFQISDRSSFLELGDGT